MFIAVSATPSSQCSMVLPPALGPKSPWRAAAPSPASVSSGRWDVLLKEQQNQFLPTPSGPFPLWSWSGEKLKFVGGVSTDLVCLLSAPRL